MAAPCMMKFQFIKTLPFEVVTCVWSPKMDILALANTSGHVMVYRRPWKKLWTYLSEGNNSTVAYLAWRPDGKLLAVAYTSGNVVLLDIECGRRIHLMLVHPEISFMRWSSHQENKKPSGKDTWESFNYFLPTQEEFLKETRKSRKGQRYEDALLLRDPKCFTLLSIGTKVGSIHLYAYGILKLIDWVISVTRNVKVYNICISTDMSRISLYVEEHVTKTNHKLRQIDVDSSLLRTLHSNITIVYNTFSQLHIYQCYMLRSLERMKESFNNTLLEMDAMLEWYSETVDVSADLLELLIFGYSSNALQDLFAIITENKLKMMEKSVILSYSNMQKLLTNNLTTAALSTFYLLNQMSRMAKYNYIYALFGIKEHAIVEAIRENASFLLKISEMMEVMNTSRHDFLIFIKWISLARMRHAHEELPPDRTKFTQHEMTSIITFLSESFEEMIVDNVSQPIMRFKLERVGQYFYHQELTIIHPTADIPWIQFLNENPELDIYPLVFKHRPALSIMQGFGLLNDKISLLNTSQRGFVAGFKIMHVQTVMQYERNATPTLDQICSNGNFLSFITHNSDLIVIKWRVPKYANNYSCPYGATYRFSPLISPETLRDSNKLLILDVHFYSENIISVLLLDNDTTIFAQLLNETLNLPEVLYRPNRDIISDNLLVNDASKFLHTSSYKCLNKVEATTFSISGQLKVAVMLSASRRRLYIYQMENADKDLKNITIPLLNLRD